ncbi:hypothetical protein [Rhizobium ruizarguesonis]|uniref:hypothetical protein n=1 Tax=Rhizobium ruizarguesonis TaxID=2081791 RepID=UPI001030512A|nr:hypothetical protein [Rhizobium ruizarguesonis]TAY79710.1 hypothetical protein ELH86_12500 [Rhizobium ruizarguesonis]
MLRQTTLPIKKDGNPVDYCFASMHCDQIGGKGQPSSIIELKELLMTLVVDRNLQSGSIKLHVLIIVVGNYDAPKLEQLENAHLLANDLVDMWASGKATPEAGMELQTVEVLWSSPNSANPKSEQPTRKNCENAFTEWADRVRVEGGVGVLHWVSHGYTLLNQSTGSGVTLLCSDAISGSDGSPLPNGHSWSNTLEFITARAGGRPLYCFVDSCRKEKTNALKYHGLGDPYEQLPGNFTQSFYSCSGDERAFWIQPHKEPDPPLFSGEAVGMRAFMAALTGFGAWINNLSAPHFDTRPDEVVEAVDWLSAMWLDHYKVSDTVAAEWEGGSSKARLTITSTPKSVIKVVSDRQVKSPTTADAHRVSDKKECESHCRTEPYWFTVKREGHLYRVEPPKGVWGALHDFRQPSGDVEVKV